ncbi:MAG TPA: carbohydrate kinase family protein [Thermoplasmatales archaeon]|nr:carbohydrate kinase family protein [Thermoplasmatales archaeon]
MHQDLTDLTKRVFDRLKQVDAEVLKGFHVVLLPDFFLDHIITFECFNDALESMRRVYDQGGGNIPVEGQVLTCGGNAANTAKTLAKLGVSTHFIGKTSVLGGELIRFFLEKEGVDVTGVKTDGKLAKTVAIEFEGRNVMISDSGSVKEFDFNSFSENDLEVIGSADMVCVTNWVLNKKGTELAKEVFSFAKKRGVKTFFDSGDPSSRRDEVDVLFKEVVSSSDLDVFSLNENELRYFAEVANVCEKNVLSLVEGLQSKIEARVDLHTSGFSFSNGVTVDSFRLEKPFVSTGAGDAWNAGNIFGELLGFRDDERLLFANAVAACYISRMPPTSPELDEVVMFLSQ